MAKQYFAFISYTSQYRSWTRTLHRNLEACLALNEQPGEIFFDETDLVGGRSWIRQLQAALQASQRLILVATPEILESDWVVREWEGFLHEHSGAVHVVRLLPTELPLFLKSVHHVDFVDHDDAGYASCFAHLLGDVLGRPRRDPPKIPKTLEIPLSPLHVELQRRVVSCLAEVLTSHGRRRLAASSCCDDRTMLDAAESPERAASLLLQKATGDDDPLVAARRVTKILAGEFAEDWPKAADRLEALLPTLTASRTSTRQPRDLLSNWRSFIVEDHSRLTAYFQEKTSDAMLERVYVDEALQLNHPTRNEEMLGFQRGDRETTIEGILRSHNAAGEINRWVLLGDPGAGKTTTLRHLACRLAQQTDSTWIPVFQSLPRLMQAEAPWFLDRIERQQRRLGRPWEGLSGVLEREGEQGRLVLLLDGLDEVQREDRREAEHLIRTVSRRWPRSAVLVTSRPIGYRKPSAEFRELRLLPFDRPRRHEFLARWFGRVDDCLDTVKANKAAALLESDRSLAELASNPLYLTLMALLIEQGTSPAANRAQLYDQVFHLLLDGKHRPEPRPMECQDAVREALRYLAFEMTQENLDSESLTAIEARLYQPEADAVRETLERVPRWRQGLRPFLTDLAEQAGILGPHDGPDTDWRFWHRTFREALASEALAERYRRGGQASVLKHAGSIAGDESRWAEAYALLTGQVDDPDTLVKALVKEQSALGLRALATAQSLAPETLQEVLELSADPDERAEVFLRLPKLVGDGERTLALIDRLRRETRNGDDLYHLDLACDLVARSDPDQVGAAKTQQERLYDHIPPPPKGLFEQVETQDGVVDLWCTIPDGTYRLGSPKEDHIHDGEHLPYAATTLEVSLRMAAVPITQAQYRVFDPDHQSDFQGDLRPVESVSWYAAIAFCRWLARHAATAGARLPTEEEWEMACRAGTSTRYWSGDTEEDLERVGWYNENSEDQTHAVGTKPKNPWGLYDVHGNVWEWTQSPWSDPQPEQHDLIISSEAATGSPLLRHVAAPDDASADLAEARRARRVVRGGGFWSVAGGARSAYRGWGDPGDRSWDLGFRVLLPSSGVAGLAPS